MGTGVLSSATDECERSAFEPRPYEAAADLIIMARQKKGCQNGFGFFIIRKHTEMKVNALRDLYARSRTHRAAVRSCCAGAFD